MKVVILAGGLPSTIGEEDDKAPKPMVRVGERPLLWHIMRLYSSYGWNDFVICTGYRSELIKDYFMNYYAYKSDITVDLQSNEVVIHNKVTEPWKVTIVYTGLKASTADRVAAIRSYVEGENFIVSYGDCISNLDIHSLCRVHEENGKCMTISVARPTGRNAILPISSEGELEVLGDIGGDAWANACNMVVTDEIFQYLRPTERFEIDTVNRLLKKQQVAVYKHEGLWLPVETMRDKEQLERIWMNRHQYWEIEE